MGTRHDVLRALNSSFLNVDSKCVRAGVGIAVRGPFQVWPSFAVRDGRLDRMGGMNPLSLSLFLLCLVLLSVCH